MFIEIIIYTMQKLVFIFMPLLVLISCGKVTKEYESVENVEKLDESDSSQMEIYPQTEFTILAGSITDNMIYFYRIEEYSLSNTYEVWVKVEPFSGEYFESSGVKYSSELSYFQIDCKSNKYSRLEYRSYGPNGNLVYSSSIPKYDVRILPESPLELLRNTLCSLTD